MSHYNGKQPLIKTLHNTNKTWQQELAEGFSNAKELCQYLDLPIDKAISSYNFPLRVPRGFADKMAKNDLNDPLLMQVLPTDQEIQQEINHVKGYSNDPVGDINAMVVSGVIHKYHGRVLLISTGACAVNCRYCFRKHFPYTDAQLNGSKLKQALQYIHDHCDITEVILSGGDPLLLNNQQLFSLIQQLEQIKHIARIRIHSRIPIVLPSRITAEFCSQLSAISKPIVIVTHANHQNELDARVQAACHKMKGNNITLLNQSVLLKGINDNAQQLCALSNKLFAYGILPYYLHLLDKAHGTKHFEVEQNLALSLMLQIKKQLPGYLVPKLVKEVAGADNKITIA